jgi:hypothetical protein
LDVRACRALELRSNLSSAPLAGGDELHVTPKESPMKFRVAVIAAAFVLSGLALAQDVQTDYDRNFDFSTLHTFAVKIGTSWGNPLGEERAKDVVSKELSQHGWTPADETTADAIVLIHGASQTKKSLDTFYTGGYGGYGWGGMGGTSTTHVNEYQVGTLVVDVFDSKTKKLVFRGVGQDELSDKPEKNQKKLEKGVDKMFKDFPPKPKEAK